MKGSSIKPIIVKVSFSLSQNAHHLASTVLQIRLTAFLVLTKLVISIMEFVFNVLKTSTKVMGVVVCAQMAVQQNVLLKENALLVKIKSISILRQGCVIHYVLESLYKDQVLTIFHGVEVLILKNKN